MKLDDLCSITDTVIDLNAPIWAAASLLGVARTASNDRSRHRRSDRGDYNDRVDLLGSLGEIFLLKTALKTFRSEELVAYMRKHLYCKEGGRGVKGPDVRFRDEGTSQLHEIDVKTFDCSPSKKFFAINNNKHTSLAGQCSAYFCIITPPFGRRMAVSGLVPYIDVEFWEVASLRRSGTPSRNCPLPDFLQRYFSSPPSIKELRGDTFPCAEIEAAKRDRRVWRALEKIVPDLMLV